MYAQRQTTKAQERRINKLRAARAKLTKQKHLFTEYLRFHFDHSEQGMFRWAFWSPDHVQRTNVDCAGTVQVPAGRHQVRRLPPEGHPRKSCGLRQHFLSRHRLGQHHQYYPQRKSVCPNNGQPFAKGQSPGIIFSSVTVPYPDSRVLPAQHSSDCKCLRSSCPYGLRTVQSEVTAG